MTDRLRLTLLQTAPRLHDVAGNVRDLLELAARARSDDARGLIITPELALTGYDLRDDAPGLALEPAAVANALAEGGPIIAGFAERSPDGAIHNSLAHVEGGAVVAVHRKVYLPTYGMFDEARVFAAGGEVSAHAWRGWRIGLLVCEDFWHPGLVYALCAQRIDLLVVSAAAPGRGVIDATGGARFESWQIWRRMAEVYARVFGIYVALANRAGVEEGITFAGGSLVVGPDGVPLAGAPEGESAAVSARLDRDELARTRTPAWHGRDDRPLVVARALLRAEGLPGPSLP